MSEKIKKICLIRKEIGRIGLLAGQGGSKRAEEWAGWRGMKDKEKSVI